MNTGTMIYKPATKEHYKPYFTYDYPHERWKVGDWILIQHVKPSVEFAPTHIISDPFLALFVGFSVWDQALVINYVRPVHPMKVFDDDPEVEHIPLWSENALVLGHWHTQPTISELKVGLRNKR